MPEPQQGRGADTVCGARVLGRRLPQNLRGNPSSFSCTWTPHMQIEWCNLSIRVCAGLRVATNGAT
eukprot:7152290-Pyramimonas_sp.AAC.1